MYKYKSGREQLKETSRWRKGSSSLWQHFQFYTTTIVMHCILVWPRRCTVARLQDLWWPSFCCHGSLWGQINKLHWVFKSHLSSLFVTVKHFVALVLKSALQMTYFPYNNWNLKAATDELLSIHFLLIDQTIIYYCFSIRLRKTCLSLTQRVCTLLLLVFCLAAICSLRVFRQYLTYEQKHITH